jgi:transketolase
MIFLHGNILNKMHTTEELKEIATQVRRDCLRMIHAVNSGHPGGALGCADFMVGLYFNIMEYKPKPFNMDGIGEDLFFLSNGHLSALWYSVLARTGHFPVPELATFRKLNTRLQGHPATEEHLEGVRMASGSLGQGLSNAIGAALTKKLNKDPHIIFSSHGDGEMEEGQIWEAAMFAAAKNVDNLIATVDYNGVQIDGPTDKVLALGDLKAKWLAFGWDVLEMNGNDMEEVVQTLKIAKAHTGKGKPVVILMKTEMGFGVDFMMGTHKWHGNAPSDEQLAKAFEQLPETLGDY